MLKKIILSTVIVLIPFILNAETVIAVIGDSNSSYNNCIFPDHEPWSYFLEKELSAYDVRIVNYSIPGTNFLFGWWMLGNAIRNEDPDLVIITLGMNDILQNTPIDQCTYYLKFLMETSLANHSKILLGKTDASYFADKGSDYISKFANLFENYRDFLDVTLFDFITFSDLVNANDHIHPSKEWHKKIASKIAELIINLRYRPTSVLVRCKENFKRNF